MSDEKWVPFDFPQFEHKDESAVLEGCQTLPPIENCTLVLSESRIREAADHIKAADARIAELEQQLSPDPNGCVLDWPWLKAQMLVWWKLLCPFSSKTIRKAILLVSCRSDPFPNLGTIFEECRRVEGAADEGAARKISDKQLSAIANELGWR